MLIVIQHNLGRNYVNDVHRFNEKLFIFQFLVGENVCASRVLRLRVLNFFLGAPHEPTFDPPPPKKSFELLKSLGESML